MKYYLFKLKFETPVHFGASQEGGALDKLSLTCHADTFFSALCNEIAMEKGPDGVKAFADKANAGEIIISDLFPFFDSAVDSYFYVPKPIMSMEQTRDAVGFEQIKAEAMRRKKQKKIEILRASQVKPFMQAMLIGNNYETDLPDFGTVELVQRVNCRGEEPLPYLVGAYKFADSPTATAGMYFVIGLQNEKLLPRIRELVEALGYSGIGGKRSSGYGKYILKEDEIEMDEQGCYEDDAALYEMLVGGGNSFMALSSFLPCPEENEKVTAGSYKLTKRSGFTFLHGEGTQIKRDSVYMLSAGSCFPARMEGQVASIVVDGLDYPIYRYGKGMFAGLSV